MLFTMDQSRSFNLCLAILTAPITSWATYSTYLIFRQPNPSISALLLWVAVVYVSASLLHGFVVEFKFYGRAQSLGCGQVAVYPHKDPILGLDLFGRQLRSLKSNTALEDLTERFYLYGHTHYELIFGKRLIVTDDVENIKTVLSTRMEDWPIAGARLISVLPIVGPKSIFSSNGKDWHDARAMLRPSFVRDQVADLRCFDRHIGNMIARIPLDGSTVDMQELLLAMSMDSSTDFLLGHSTGLLTEDPLPETREFTRAFEEGARQSSLMTRLGPVLYHLPHKSLDENVKKIRGFVRHYLRKVATEKGAKTEEDVARNYVFLDELLKTGAPEEYVIDQILSVLIAGRDTTAMGIAVCFWYLARNPEVVAKLRAEMASVGAEDPTWEQLKGMRYLNNIIKEALRLVPPVSTNQRQSNRETNTPIGGGPGGRQPVLVPKGTAIRFSLISMHRNKDLYGPDAEVFRPESWDDEGFRPGWAYIPFHGGPRICIGQQFALTQLSYVLYRVFQRFKAIEPRDERPMKLASSITTSFANGVLASMTPV